MLPAPAAAALVVAFSLASCAPDFRPASRMLAGNEALLREPTVERRHTYYSNDAKRPHRDWSVKLYPNGSQLPHGADKSWFPNGKPEWERAYAEGEPTGHWLSWYENGSPRSEATFGGAQLAPMRWWYENGQLSSEGPALDGVRDGEWTTWHKNGNKATQGPYRLGKKEGPWSFWNEDGSLKETVQYRDDLRVGPVESPASPQQNP